MYKRRSAIRALTQGALLQGAVVVLTACSPDPGRTTQPPPPSSQYRLTASIPELMDGIIDPAADLLWDSVAYIASTQGVEDRRPRTDEEWKRVRYGAITLIEAANLLSMPGRGAPAEIQRRIEGTRPAFAQFARNLQDAGLRALAAIDAKDPERLMDAGGEIDTACEACHVTYWYPEQSRPGN